MTKFLIWGEKKGVNIQQGNTKYAKYELLGLLKATGCCLSNKIPFYGTVARVFLLIVLRDSISKWEACKKFNGISNQCLGLRVDGEKRELFKGYLLPAKTGPVSK